MLNLTATNSKKSMCLIHIDFLEFVAVKHKIYFCQNFLVQN